MKEKYLRFEDYPLRIPTEKRTINKAEAIISELEQCGTMLTAALTAANKDALPALVNSAINAAKLKM